MYVNLSLSIYMYVCVYIYIYIYTYFNMGVVQEPTAKLAQRAAGEGQLWYMILEGSQNARGASPRRQHQQLAMLQLLQSDVSCLSARWDI